MSETKTPKKTTGNYMERLGMTPEGEIQENTNHTVIFNLKRNLEQCRKELIACRKELIACRANNNNFKKQLELVGSKKTRRRSHKKRIKSRKKRRKR